MISRAIRKALPDRILARLSTSGDGASCLEDESWKRITKTASVFTVSIGL